MAHDSANMSDKIRLRLDSVYNASELRSIANALESAQVLEEMSKDELIARLFDAHNVDNADVLKGVSKADLVEHIAAREHGLSPGEIIHEGTPLEVKGPGPEWSGDANG